MTPLLYVDLIRKELHCCNCMEKKPIDPHHIRQVGMGRDRKKELIEHYSCIPLCRKCHTEYHDLGKTEFEKKNKIDVFEQSQHYLSKYIYKVFLQYDELIKKKDKENGTKN